MRISICVIAVFLISFVSMHLIWDLIIQACDTRGQFENNGTTYMCHKFPAPTGEKEEK